MSGRTVPRLLLVALLTAAFAAPAVAQIHAEEEIFRPEGLPIPLPEAPMPRAKANRPDLRFYSQFDITGLGFKVPLNSEPPVPPMPTPVPPELPVPPMTPPTPPVFAEAAPDFRFPVPQLGPIGLALDIDFPLQQCPNDKRQVFNFSVGVFGSKQAQDSGSSCGFGSYCAPQIPRLVAPAQAQPGPLMIAPGFDLLPAPPVQVQHETVVKVIDFECVKACPANPLLGTWYREMPYKVLSATFTHDELKLCMTYSGDGMSEVVTITAHYTLTKDGLVYGAITGADADVKHDLKPGESTLGVDGARITLAAALQKMVDVPFSFRAKHTSVGVMFSQVKFGLLLKDEIETEIFGMDLGGMFKPAKDGRVPTPVAVKTGRADKLAPATPDCPPRVGIDFSVPPVLTEGPNGFTGPIWRCPADSTAPPTMCPPRAPDSAVAPPCQLPMPQPVKPVGCGIPNDGTKQLATEAFGQLLQQGGVLPPLPAPPVASVGPVKGVAESRWCRDVAGKQCVLKLAPDHFTLTVIESHDENGKVSTASLIITADYHTTRDGLTAVGLITSVDVRFEGEFPPEDSKPFFEMLGELQKALEDKPFAMSLRSYDDALVIGNVRMPSVSDRMEVQPAGYLAGRYAPAGDKLPKPKVLKISEPKAVPPAPSIYSGPATGTQGLAYPLPYLPPSAPSSEMLPPQALPSPRAIVPSSGSWTPPVPSMTEPTPPPVPRMPQPTPPGASANEEPTKPATSKVLIPGLLYANLSDPNIRVKQLLYESKDLRQIQNEWRPFWFKDRPGHLTPERIHGGIY